MTDYRTKPASLSQTTLNQTALSQTLARGLTLLELIAEGREGVPVRELAAAMGLPRSIVQRLLNTLQAAGYLERHPSRVGYRLAIKLWRLGCQSVRRLSVHQIARPSLESLSRRTNEMTKLAVLAGGDVVYIDGVDCAQSVRAYVPIGGNAPAHCSATGKAILAFLPVDRLAAVGPPNRRYTPQTVVDTQAFARDMQRIRQRGYAINRGEWEAGVGGVAAPIFDAEGQAVASIGIILPLARFPLAKAAPLGALTRAAAADISRQLGHRGEPEALQRIG
ncbi:MAG: IclR family transcriptional regulator [Hyphomicrobiales bacterium]|nr:IclR family transcriptional regulator [Hyphomicrobiales bacterium]